jgi:RNA polymerase-binding transcription factor DksA
VPLKPLLTWDQRRQLREQLAARVSTLREEPAGETHSAQDLPDITRALERLDSPAFGRCDGCGAPIAWARLLTRPQATRCTRCAARAPTPPNS